MAVRSVLTALAVALVIAGAPAADAAGAVSPPFFAVHGIHPGHVLWLRAKGHKGAVRIGLVPSQGRRLANLGCVGAKATGWCHVRYKGTAGWVPARFLTPDKARMAVLAMGDTLG